MSICIAGPQQGENEACPHCLPAQKVAPARCPKVKDPAKRLTFGESKRSI